MTVQDVIDGALAHSTLNDQTVIATDAELVSQVDRILKELMARHPRRFPASQQVAAPGAGNPYSPSTASSEVFHCEKTDGTVVHIVPVEDKDAAYDPRIYALGRNFYPVASDPDDTADALVFYIGNIPTTLTVVGSTITTDFPEHYARLLELKLARYLARKDNRLDEVADLVAEITPLEAQYDAEMTAYAAAVEHRAAEN